MAQDQFPSAGTGGTHGFSVRFEFPVHFTRDAWTPSNTILVDTVRRLEPARRHRLFVAVDDRVLASHPRLLASIHDYVAAFPQSLELAGPPQSIPGGEIAKNDLLQVVNLMTHMNDVGLDRQSFVVAVGGGAVLDVVSFAAAIAHRGIRTVRFPTTTLAQGDSGIAVKNSVNLFGKKNFVGTFVPPFAVINDAAFLDTLDQRERIGGVAEAIKVALLRDPAFFDYIEAHARDLVVGTPGVLAAVVRRSAELHLAHICGNGDPFELGSARPLDFGHWVGHKLEAMTSHVVRHGEGVAIGMAADVVYSVKMGYLAAATGERILRLLESLGFTLWHDALRQEEIGGGLTLLRGLREFREHLGGELHITLLRDIGRSFEVTSMAEPMIVEALWELAARAEAPDLKVGPTYATMPAGRPHIE